MKLTAKQLSDIYYDHYNRATGASLDPNHENPMWSELTDTLNDIIELENCHELALAQNVAVDTVIEWINDHSNTHVPRQAEYDGMFMKPTPPPLTRAHLLRHLLDNEKDGRDLYHGLEINYFEDQWSSIDEHCGLDIQQPENYRIIK